MGDQQPQPGRQILLTGATGSMGLAITRELVAGGHAVLGVTRSSEGARALADLGATPVEVDLFDAEAVRAAAQGCDVIAHFATSIPTGRAASKAGSWTMNDRLRSEGTANLIAAAEAVGAERVIFESIALAYPDRGSDWIDEDTALDPPAPMMRTAVEAEAMLAAFAARGGEAVSLRFGRLYGPGRASDDLIAALRAKQLPIIGNGKNLVSSVHVEDVGAAVGAAVTVLPGRYNIVDDVPMTQRELMNTICAATDAPTPRRVPYVIARLVAGKAARVLTVSQRVSNGRFREATGWTPRYPSAAEGWAAMATAASEPARTPA